MSVAAPEGSLHVAFSGDARLAGESFELREGRTPIGRDVRGTALRIGDEFVSALHCYIRWDRRTNHFRLDDAESLNETFVNGRPITSALLSSGDVIRLGNTLLAFSPPALMATMKARAKRGAASDLTVLLLGETGSGKEVLARQMHTLSGREGPFVALNCATLHRDLISAELFGHTKRAFSGAIRERPGLFLAAKGGTLFLDEVGELPVELQPALLRALQERLIRPVGSDAEIPVDVRLIAATNVDLSRAVREGQFRGDLYSRLAELVFRVPSLRERKRELFPLVNVFAKDGGAGRDATLTADAAEALLLWHWPYNVRELKSLVRSFCALSSPGDVLDLNFLADRSPAMVMPVRERARAKHGASQLSSAGDDSERERFRRVLVEHRGNVRDRSWT